MLRFSSYIESNRYHRGVGRLSFMRTMAALVAAHLFLSTVGIGQIQSPRTVGDHVGSAAGSDHVGGGALPADIMKLRREGHEALYNLDNATAVEKFEEIRRRAPHHPAGDLYLATAIWLKHLSKTRRLQTGLYSSGSSFYSGASASKEEAEGDAVDMDVDRAFRERMAQAKTKALALVAKYKNDADALYFLGSYYGLMAGYEASTARKFLSAMRNGSRCVDAHEKVLKLKPDYYDAYLSIGVYDYIVGNLPFSYKFLATMAGVRGNKKRGITRLQTIIEKNAATADDARVLLVAIFRNEKRYEDALSLLEQLSSKYPSGYLLKLEKASTLVTLNRANDAYAVFESLLKDPSAASALDLINYQYAEALARNKEYKRAAAAFIATNQIQGADANLATISRLRAAQMYDLAGERKEAISNYNAVLARPNVYDTKQQAEKGLNKPFIVKEKKGD
ncbi:MAG TPA: tetratricopeptide repeat protein [Blastocatellia bacterium]|nr:tetratricopeptide repeat protein [Blastocatellia bacterium]